MIARIKAPRARGFLYTFIAIAIACVFAAPQGVQAYNPNASVVKVGTLKDLLVEIAASRTMSYEKNIVLTADIDFTDDIYGDRLEQIVKEHGSLTFGDKDHPFKGSFDGGGHYIIGLDYHRDFWKPVANTGLFSFTEGAYIHDIHFKDCYIGADFRGGVLVGYADNTRIESVRMEDCTISVTPANNSVSLITNAGIMGGMIVGEMVNKSSLYDCTVQGGRVVNNSVVAVSGLGGEGLYLGALVGSAENSEIEYCRVLPKKQYYLDRAIDPNVSVYDKDNNGHYKYQTEVYNRYEVAVGAVAGQSVYAGGIVGYTKNVDVVDCFSTAWVHTWVANYVGVGSGNIGYVGGIITHAKSDGSGDTSSQVVRCHYAGNMESFQWNAVAVIPIIQSNVYLAGLVERDWEEDTGIYNSYFKRNDVVGKDSAIKPHPDGYIRSWGDWLGLNYDGGQNGPSAQGFSYGPIVDDKKYADRLFWEGEGYDFEGDETRYSMIDPMTEPHVNKWIMDDYLGIPVHGASVKATLDFPGAGSVTMLPTTMGSEQATSDPYTFAVQATSANETELGLKATTTPRVDDSGAIVLPGVSDLSNGGYRFGGWYRQQDVSKNHIKSGDHAFFDPIVPPEPHAEKVSDQDEYTAHNSGTGGATASEFKDNDLFVAYYQAQVLFHNVKGGVIDKTTVQTEQTPATDDDWYNHKDGLPLVDEPKDDRTFVDGENNKLVSDGAKFLGWTTLKNNQTQGGWPDVTTTQINEMKTSGSFYEGGEPVERPMDLYPVYASLGANIEVVAEGHELVDGKAPQGTSFGTNVREGVVQANLTPVNGRYELSITGLDASNNPLPDGKLPDGYRFLGWYEIELDGQGNPLYTERPGVLLNDPNVKATAYEYRYGLKLSSEPTYIIPSDVDLSRRHAYYARFEYRVDYWVKSPSPEVADNEWANPVLLASRWEPYLGGFENIAGPYFYDWVHDHWTLDSIDGCDESEAHWAQNSLSAGIAMFTKVNGHNVRTEHLDDNYGVDVYTDFPHSADVRSEHLASNSWFTVIASPHKNFQFRGWTWIRNQKSGISGPSDTEFQTESLVPNTAEYWYEAHLVAEIDFMDADANAANPYKTVTRAYSNHKSDEPLGLFTNGFQTALLSQDVTYQYRFPYRPSADDSDKLCGLETTSEASPTNDEMQSKRPGLLFLGWIDKTAIDHGTMSQAEYEAIYDEVTRTAKVSIEAITPYLVTADTLCEYPMTLYPVYADFSCDTANNITRGTALTDPENPKIDPALGNVKINGDGTKTATVSADVDSATAAAYDLVSWTIESPEGTVIETVTATDGAGHPVAGGQGGVPVSNENSKLSYNIIAGTRYVIVANYRAKTDAELIVVYHVRPSSDAVPTVEVKKVPGDLLGRAPLAEFAPQNAVLVGWTQEKPAPGKEYVMFDTADPSKMVDEVTVVEHSMELWPVYRVVTTGEADSNADVRVNSNIDAEINRTDHRRAEVVAVDAQNGKQTYVSLIADQVNGYKFLGWYKDYVGLDVDGKVLGVPVAGNRVTGEEVFGRNLYTAVYKKTQVYSVVYHFPENKTSTVEIDEDNPTGFVDKVTVQKPVLDENGNPRFDKDGNPIVAVKEEFATVVGGEQTAAMEGALDKINKAGQYRELFCEWEWRKASGTVVPWDSFCGVDKDGNLGKGIVTQLKEEGTTEMHLYPVTHRLNAIDAEGKPYPASNLVWQIDPAALADNASSPDAPNAKPAVKIAFGPRTLYTGNSLTIHMDLVHYAVADGAEPSKVPVNDKLVVLYDNFDLTTATELDRKVTGRVTTDPAETPGEGNAVFHFKTDGTLTIEKIAPVSAAGSTFTFTVTQCDENGAVQPGAKTATVMLTAAADGNAARALGTLNLPWGYYKVEESTWGWRYLPTYQFFENGMTVEGRSANVVLIKSKGNVKVTNSLANGNYLDGEDRTQNVFGEGPKKMAGGAR